MGIMALLICVSAIGGFFVGSAFARASTLRVYTLKTMHVFAEASPEDLMELKSKSIAALKSMGVMQ